MLIRAILRLTALLPFVFPLPLRPQSVIGTWQGTLANGPRPLHMIVRIAAERAGRLTASLVSADEGVGFDRSYMADTVVRRGPRLTLTWTNVRVRYVGTLSADGRSIEGTWTEGLDTSALELIRATPQTAWRDSAPHVRHTVRVAKGVELETLDWGGRGRAVVLLAGNGNTGHVFDEFARNLTADFHVYAITRRGFGRSSAPPSGYLADSLADDVLAVMDSLRIPRPVLVGHSLAGEELSSIGSRRPDRVAGLVYLDAIDAYAFFDSTRANWALTARDAQRTLLRLVDPAVAMSVAERRATIMELLQTSLPLMERDLRAWERQLATQRNQTVRPPARTSDPVQRALSLGHQQYTTIRAPALAIVAFPRLAPPALAPDSAARARIDSLYIAAVGPQIDAFERGVPGVRVVKLPHADHYVFRSHEADVLRELRSFITRLPNDS